MKFPNPFISCTKTARIESFPWDFAGPAFCCLQCGRYRKGCGAPSLSLLFVLTGRTFEAVEFFCAQGGSCAAMPFAGLLNVNGLISYLFAMGYFGYQGKELLVADLLKHGYFVEGTARPIEPDEYES
ncbi:MAG TPA: hypothetical protein VF798_14340 [Burkholderiaceae bacterium]